jgi:tetratricopeptide (TPR) repeat protein/NAD(P)-dependent dehydrogenase (short-subunit alcohol dehydrogenase family)
MAEYELRVETDSDQKVARLKLFHSDGRLVENGSNEITLPEHSSALWEGLFDTRRYIGRYERSMRPDGQTEPATAEQLLQRLAEFLGQHVLGEAIVRELAGPGRRVLIVRVPTTDEDVLAAAFARVPWEIARLPDGTRLRNLVVRAVTTDTEQGNVAVPEEARRVARGETLRVLAVFAEAPGLRPLAMRLEREQLRRLFAVDILPHRNVELDVLCHGVTRKRLREAILSRHGYHVVHWSGHGHHNSLDLQGEPDNRVTGGQLVELFIEAGGFIPQIFFLSACHSGSMLRVKDWQSLKAALEQGEEHEGHAASSDDAEKATTTSETKQLEDAYQNPTGYTGTALALLKAGVPQVVAMRYAVGDEYARALGRAFYRRLLADPDVSAADEALATARSDVLDDPEQSAYHAVDHATPLMFGQTGRLLEPARTRSPQMDRLRPKPQPLVSGGRTELDPPAVFVGRGEPLTRLGREWLGEDGPAVALVQGLAGLGKTVLAAEAIHLWHERFDYVLAFQAKPSPLQLDDFSRQVDQRLMLESRRYRQKCEQNPYSPVYLDHDPEMFPSPEDRYERMRSNLVEALRDEAILLVLDNFETNLESVETAAGSSLYACSDPAWDDLLSRLVRDLPSTPRSRLLVTARHRPRALANAAGTLWIPLGPLPMGEAALYLRNRPELRKLLFGDDPRAKALVYRLLEVSRGHPLILDRFAGLAHDPPALSAALDRVRADGWQQLPDLFAGDSVDDAQRERERRYLEDVATGSVDLLIERLTPDARRLLRIVTLANEPVSGRFIEGVWQGKSVEDELRRNPSPQPEAPPVGPLLAELHGAGLLTKEEPPAGSAGGWGRAERAPSPPEATYAFHELVRERTTAWMAAHPDAPGPRTDDEIRIAYGERYARMFDDLYHEDRDAAGEAGRRALVYFVAARAFERLGSFASNLVTGVSDPTLLRGVVAELEGAIDQAPPGKPRWGLRTYVADALLTAGQPDRALPFYAAAAKEAETAEHWSDVAWITGNWANAVGAVGDLEESKRLQLSSASASRRLGKPEVHAMRGEIEALRIDVLLGGAKDALPDIQSRLDLIRHWWQRTLGGETVAEAPDRVFLGRGMVSALDIAEDASRSLRRWEACLDLLKETESAKRALGENEFELARTRLNQCEPLIGLGRLDEAQRVLEGCLPVYRSAGAAASEARCLSALGNVWDKRNEPSQAIALARQALAVCNTLPDPSERAISHGNLSNYFAKAGRHAEAAAHRLAAGVYWRVMGRRDHLATWLRNLRIDARRALANGQRYTLPRLEEAIAWPEFAALRQFLESGGVDRSALQAEIDRLVDQAHEQARGNVE